MRRRHNPHTPGQPVTHPTHGPGTYIQSCGGVYPSNHKSLVRFDTGVVDGHALDRSDSADQISEVDTAGLRATRTA